MCGCGWHTDKGQLRTEDLKEGTPPIPAAPMGMPQLPRQSSLSLSLRVAYRPQWCLQGRFLLSPFLHFLEAVSCHTLCPLQNLVDTDHKYQSYWIQVTVEHIGEICCLLGLRKPLYVTRGEHLASVSLGCCTKRSQNRWLKQQKCVFSHFWRAGRPRARCQSWFLVGFSSRIVLPLLSVLTWLFLHEWAEIGKLSDVSSSSYFFIYLFF